MGLFSINPFTFTRSTILPPVNDTNLKLDREKHGRCANCGLQTHEVKRGLFFIGTVLEPITNDIILRGRCLVCNPVNSTGVSKAGVEDADEAVPIDHDVNITILDSPLVNITSSEVAQSRDRKCYEGCAERRLYLIILLVVLLILVVIGFSLYAAVGRSDTSVSQESEEDPNDTSKIPSQTLSTVTSVEILQLVADQTTVQPTVQLETMEAPTDTTTEAVTTTETPSATVTLSEATTEVASDPTTTQPDLRETPEAPTDTSTDAATTTEEPATTTTSSESTTSTTRLRDETLIEEDLEASVLSRGVKFSELAETDSRKLALDWLLHDDEMQLDVPDLNLHQRYILALLAFNSGSDFRSFVDWLSETDECVWEGVTCDANGEVIKLELGKTILRIEN